MCMQVRKLPVHSVKAQLLSEERFQGRVVTELNSGQWRSEVRNIPLHCQYKCQGKGTSAELSHTYTREGLWERQ